jgi:hypothetical protein
MNRIAVFAGVSVLLASSMAMAATLYSENFEVDHSANWTVNKYSGIDEAHDMFFDYSTVGIPAAPSGTGTRGMKLQAHLTTGTALAGMTASPTGQSFTGNYTVSFDWWESFYGPAPYGDAQAHNLGTFGVGTSGTKAQYPGGAMDSVWFAATGDGGSTADWRAYAPGHASGYVDGDPVYEATTRDSANAYYSGFGNASAPAAQVALYPDVQTGTTAVGSAGWAWHQVDIEMKDGIATWTVDGLLIATVDSSAMTLGGSNIFFGHSDINGTISTNANASALLFTLIDNIVVTPEPASLSLLAIGSLALLRRRR